MPFQQLIYLPQDIHPSAASEQSLFDEQLVWHLLGLWQLYPVQ